ncbi:hypothetical protein AHOG_20785 [Actinoalloteichus hoggarensis]|uniref:Uncharacterized protein n=1 Tax=Actinoalloteichus hoggarensis TaxID=1470176 RepID=A0A221W7P6_9PSEU|nr:hypothetical protein AHOG_20785 [Actinoalloteichus hoggarensis]
MLSVLVVLALIVFVPGPVFRLIHFDNARQLVDEVSTGRAELLSMQDEFRSPIASLGSPARSWTQVSCRLSPRYSDGDGEQGVVMFYRQGCSLVAYEIYALPPDAGGAADVAEILGGRFAGTPACFRILFDVLTPDYGASASSEYATALWWTDPHGEPPAEQPDRCALPTPDDPGAAHVERGVEGPMTAETYVVYQVRSPVSAVDVGCERRLSWLAPCRGEPQGFPAL